MRIVKNEILLFKSSNDDVDHVDNQDPYVTLLRQSKFTVKTVPVLDFSYCHLDILKRRLLNPETYSGIIFTSPRAVIAATVCLEATCLPDKWRNLPSFVVGEGTARILKEELSLKGEGSSSGNASNLADIILKNKYTCPLLFPCGKLKRDVLPTKLEEGGVKLDVVTVYESFPHPNIEENIQSVTSNGESVSEFVVFFSPSGVKFSMPVFQTMKIPFDCMKLIAIGPTTKKCLEDHQFQVWSIAEKPTPESLLEAILSF